MAAPPLLDFCTVLGESKRIINAHSRHFLALSVLFLLPLSFSLIVYPTIQQLILQSATPNSQILILASSYLQSDQPILPTNTLLLILIYTLFILALALCAVGSITYSVFHGFYGRPVKLISAIRSIFTSFLPLLATVIVSQTIVSGLFIISGLILFLVVRVIELFGLQIELSSPYFVGFFGFVLLVLVLVLVYLQVNSVLASVVVVVESSWGFQSLRRSKSLIRGMRRVALSFLLFFGFFVGILILGSSMSAVGSDGIGEKWESWAFVVQIVVTSTLLTLLLLYNVAANTVLYMHCKATHGELAMEIAEEFAREYVSLPFDDGKVPHVVSVVYG